MPLRNIQRLRQLARAGAKAMDVLNSAARPHDAEASPRLERTNQDQSTPGRAFHEHIEHPVHAVIQINIDGPSDVPLNECAAARPGKGVAGFVIQREIGLCLDHNS